MQTQKIAKPNTQWMITFADLLSLLLTFFILLFSMSEIKKKEWETLTSALQGEKLPAHSKATVIEDDAPVPPRIVINNALNLPYVEHLLKDKLQAYLGKELSLAERQGTLVIHLSADTLFRSGSASFNEAGIAILRVVANAVSSLPNKIDVVGHTDPNPVASDEYPSNWELSLARAYAVTALLQGAGYSKPIVMSGAADGRFRDIDATVYRTKAAQYRHARRVDIVISQTSD